MGKRGLILAAALMTGGVAPSPLVERVDRVVLDPAGLDPAFGGISTIDHDRRTRQWLLISDDRSDRAPARYYSARIEIAQGRWRIRVGRGTPLRDRDGAMFPAAGSGREAVDPEAIRVAPDGNAVWWSSEGDARDGYGPAVRRMDRGGREIETIMLPDNLRFDPTGGRGSRNNGTLEGMAFAPDGALWLAMESPLVEDGEPAAVGRTALVRFTRIERGKPARQFGYRLDAVPPTTQGKGADNGVTEILALDDRRMLVIERSGARDADGSLRFHCRLYLADFGAAENIVASAGLAAKKAVPAAKRLLLDFDTLPGDTVGNLEGMAWWPGTEGARRQILLVNDNNFAVGEPTRLLLLSLAPGVVQSRTH